jgi:hypothetical protein
VLQPIWPQVLLAPDLVAAEDAARARAACRLSRLPLPMLAPQPDVPSAYDQPMPRFGDLVQTTAGTWIVRAPTHCPVVI